MTSKQKESELLRQKTILFATIDYLLSKHGGSIVNDGEDVIAEYYRQQKWEVEKFFEERKLYGLKQQFLRLIKGAQNRADLNFQDYIKEKTGYDIDIFEDLRKRADVILAKNEIQSKKEFYDIYTMIHFYQTMNESDIVDKLKTIHSEYYKKNKSKTPDYTKVISRVEENGVEKVTMSSISGPKPKHWEVQEAVSPDGNRRLHITQWSDGKYSSTSVTIIFPTASGNIYGVNGICPDVNAFWKDNSTIIIETSKSYSVNIKTKEIRSFADVINVEYIER